MIVISFWFSNRWSKSSCSVFNIIHLRTKLEDRRFVLLLEWN